MLNFNNGIERLNKFSGSEKRLLSCMAVGKILEYLYPFALDRRFPNAQFKNL